ncbi:MAG: hypothetical protein HYX41_02780 [Bdellovibrio sp.]|nr:hypothetical protein [Bdellovibrio sp.]
MKKSCDLWIKATLRLGIASAILFCGASSFADLIVHHWEDQFEESGFFRTKLEGLYFNTVSNFESNGSSLGISGLQNYNRIGGDLTLAAGLFRPVTLYGRLHWVGVNQTGVTRSGNSFGLGDQSIGLAIRLFTLKSGPSLHPRQTQFDFQFQTDFPLYNNATADANLTPYFGDGSTDLSAGIFLTHSFHEVQEDGYQFQLGTGYTSRNQGFSAAIPFNVNLSYESFDSGVLASLGIQGFASLKTDTSGVSTLPRSSAGSAGSYFTGGANSSLAQFIAKIGYRTSPSTELTGGVALHIWGQSAPGGVNVTLGFSKRFGGPDIQPAVQTESEYGKANKGFVNYSLEAKVLKSRDQLNIFKIDKGKQEGVEVGQIFDIFIVQKDGSIGDPIARAEVTHIKLDEAALEVTEHYSSSPVNEGYLARRVIK